MSGKKEQVNQEEEMENFKIPTHDADGKELTKTLQTLFTFKQIK